MSDSSFDLAVVVGADGPKSRIAEAFALDRNTQFLFGIEHEYRDAGLPESDALHCFIDARLAPGYIGWALRWSFDRFQADWIFNLMLNSWPMRRAAEIVYFHRRRV